MAGTDKTERLVNLIALLLETRRPLSAAEIRRMIPAYEGQGDEAFHRMFERDKSELREIGLVLEQDQSLDGETGYRIAKDEALLDDPGLAPDEVAALSLAAQAWGGDGTLGLLKLSVGAGTADPGFSGWVLPRVPFDRTVALLVQGIEERRAVRFRYRTGGAGEESERVVEPHGLIHRGDWYLRGFDRTRGEDRSFKLARVAGAVTLEPGAAPQFEPPPPADRTVSHGPWEGDETDVTARVAFAPDAAWWVERRTGARTAADRDDGWVELEMPCANIHSFAGWVAGFGDQAVVLAPAELREAVVAHLRSVEDG